MNTSIVILFIALISTAAQTRPDLMSGPERTVDQFRVTADSLFRACNWNGTRKTLVEARRRYPGNAEILWRLSNSYINEGDALEGDRAEASFRRAIACAEQAVAADSKNANAHAMYAASLGSLAMFAGGREKVKLTYKIKDALDRALALDPANQIAHTIAGTWHREVADVSWIERQLAEAFLGGLPDGSFEESVRHLRDAIKVEPTRLRHHYELGLTYDAMDQPARAAQSYRTALACQDSWSIDWKRRAFMKEYLEDM